MEVPVGPGQAAPSVGAPAARRPWQGSPCCKAEAVPPFQATPCLLVPCSKCWLISFITGFPALTLATGTVLCELLGEEAE